ncbi:hypothetical protein LCGC14_2236350, partial [marine sediment metagenome]
MTVLKELVWIRRTSQRRDVALW